MTTPPPETLPAEAERASPRLKALLALLVLVVGTAGYTWLGNRQGWAAGPADSLAARQAPANHAGNIGPEQIADMAQRLAERLKQQPEDAEGWAMLGRTYAVLGRHAEAVPAFQALVKLRPQDAQALADLADALGMAQGRSLEGEPARLIEQALAIDGRNLKALALAGTVAMHQGDKARAVALWERAKAVAEPGGEMARNLEAGIAQLREGGAAAPKAEAAPATEAAAAPGVSGRVSLAPALAAQAAPEDTVFIFARAAQGPRMPLAILKKQVKDLPADFTLDDSLAMSPAARLSAAGTVVVGARISKSGQAMPQPGDLQGLSAPVAVGATGVVVQITEAVK